MSKNSRMTTDGQKNLRVLHVVGSLNRGGVETWLAALFVSLKEDAHVQSEVLIQEAADENGYTQDVQNVGVRVRKMPRDIRWPVTFYRFLKKSPGFDVVHSHRNEFSAFVLLIAFFAGVPIRVAHSHSDRTRSERWTHWVYRHFSRWLLRIVATKRIGVSESARQSLFGASNSDSEVVYCGLNLHQYRYDMSARERIRSSLAIPETARVVAHVGGFRFAKNHRFIVQVFAALQELPGPPAHLVLVGDGALKPEIQKVVAERGMTDAVHFLGVRDDVSEILSAADVLLFPSFYEGLGLTVIEAQANGLPSVISDTIPGEVVLVKDLVTTLSLELRASEWGEVLNQTIDHSRARPFEYDELKQFDIRVNKASTMKIYHGK